MAIIARFQPTNMNADRYAEVMRRLAATGLAAPQGRVHHVAFGPTERLQVVDVWDTPESLQAFGEHLFPVLADLGVQIGEPEVQPVHNIVR